MNTFWRMSVDLLSQNIPVIFDVAVPYVLLISQHSSFGQE